MLLKRRRRLGRDFAPASLQPLAALWCLIGRLGYLGAPWVRAIAGPRSAPLAERVALRCPNDAYKGKLVILPGGGVTYENVKRIVKELGVKEAHGTKIVDLNR